MPELAEVEIVRLGLESSLINGLVYSAKIYDDKFSDAALSNGCFFRYFKREGKFIVIGLENSTESQFRYEMIISLGMTGSLIISNQKEYENKHVRVQFCMKNEHGENKWLLFIDPRKFGSIRVVKPGERDGLISKLGPDPLDVTFGDSEALDHQVRLLARRKKPIKTVLLEQEFAAGIGNYLADEILFRALINPLIPANELSIDDVATLNECVEFVVKEALRNGGNSFSDYVNTNGESGSYFGLMKVYGREGCTCVYFGCNSKIKKIDIGGRGTHFCPSCQPMRT